MVSWIPGITLETVERETILQAFKFYHEDKTATANALKISVRTLYSKLEQYDKENVANANERTKYEQQEIEAYHRARGNVASPAKYRTADSENSDTPEIGSVIKPDAARGAKYAERADSVHTNPGLRVNRPSSSPAKFRTEAESIELERKTSAEKTDSEDATGFQVDAGLLDESTSRDTAEQSLPVSQQNEVQEMLQDEVAASSDDSTSQRVSGSDVEARPSVSHRAQSGNNKRRR